jgi:hypothetical protein
MIPINNSDTAWLIITDFNQDNDLPYEYLREDILDPDVNHHDYEYYVDVGRYVGTVIDGIGRQVGDYQMDDRPYYIYGMTAGSEINRQTGWSDFGVGGNIHGGVADFGGRVGDTISDPHQ